MPTWVFKRRDKVAKATVADDSASRLLGIALAEAAARVSQGKLNDELVAQAIRATPSSVLHRMITLDTVDPLKAIESLARRSGKGFAFEALDLASHLGKAPGNGGYQGVGDVGGLSRTDPRIDVAHTNGSGFWSRLFGASGTAGAEVFRLKSSVKKALSAISDPAYDGVPIRVPADVYDQMAASTHIKLQEAMSSGKLVRSDVASKHAIDAAKREITRRVEGKELPSFGDRLAKEVGAAATMGAAVGAAASVGIALWNGERPLIQLLFSNWVRTPDGAI